MDHQPDAPDHRPKRGIEKDHGVSLGLTNVTAKAGGAVVCGYHPHPNRGDGSGRDHGHLRRTLSGLAHSVFARARIRTGLGRGAFASPI